MTYLDYVNAKLGSLWGCVVTHCSYDILRQKLYIRAVALSEEKDIAYELEFREIKRVFFVNDASFGHFNYPLEDEDILPYVEITELEFFESQVIWEVTKSDESYKHRFHLHILLWEQDYFIDCEEVVLNGEVFKVREIIG